MNYKKETIDDLDLFIYSIIGENKWDKIPPTKKFDIIKKYKEIQDLVKEKYSK